MYSFVTIDVKHTMHAFLICFLFLEKYNDNAILQQTNSTMQNKGTIECVLQKIIVIIRLMVVGGY